MYWEWFIAILSFDNWMGEQGVIASYDAYRPGLLLNRFWFSLLIALYPGANKLILNNSVLA
jgi:hypothetical protein